MRMSVSWQNKSHLIFKNSHLYKRHFSFSGSKDNVSFIYDEIQSSFFLLFFSLEESRVYRYLLAYSSFFRKSYKKRKKERRLPVLKLTLQLDFFEDNNYQIIEFC